MPKKLRDSSSKKPQLKYNKVKLPEQQPPVETQWVVNRQKYHDETVLENTLQSNTDFKTHWYSLNSEQTQLDKAACNKIIKDFQTQGVHNQAAIGVGDVDPNIRQVHQWNYETLEYFDFFQALVNNVNDHWWQYDLTQIEVPTLCVYYGDRMGKYSWHKDSFYSDKKQARKISATILLNDSSEFTGGDLEIFSGVNFDGKPIIEKPQLKKAGDAVFFGAHDYHRVLPVTKGTRASLVLWMWGPRLR